MSPLPAKKRDYYTFSDYLSWDETQRIELIEGIPVSLATPSRRHQEIVGEVHRQLANYLVGKKCRAYIAPFAVRLFEQAGDALEDVDTVVEPDIAVVCDPEKLDDTGCKGTPDLVIEILSPSTRRNDRIVKLDLYQRAGVREYWIVSPEEKTVLVYLREEDALRPKENYSRTDSAKVSVLEDCSIRLDTVFPE